MSTDVKKVQKDRYITLEYIKRMCHKMLVNWEIDKSKCDELLKEYKWFLDALQSTEEVTNVYRKFIGTYINNPQQELQNHENYFYSKTVPAQQFIRSAQSKKLATSKVEHNEDRILKGVDEIIEQKMPQVQSTPRGSTIYT